MIVMKFGGTSVEDAASVERVAEIIRARLHLRPIIVVSAMGKTTRNLLRAAEASAAGDSPTTLDVIGELKARHVSEAHRLVTDSETRQVFKLIERYFDELKKLLEGLAILGEVPPRGLDKILSYGELLSSAIVADALAERGIPARLLDSRKFIITDDRYGAASPIQEITDQKIQEMIAPAVAGGATPVIQGFIGSTREGATTTLGFEGSDYTATIVGAALDARVIQIWKDVSGLMTADPAVFARSRTVKVCSFAEAGELTYFGAKVLHPKAVHPAARRNIPVHIYNSKQPGATGTSITATVPRSANLIKSIAYKRPVTLIHAVPDNGAGESPVSTNDFLRSLLSALSRRSLAPLLTAVSASNVTLALDAQALAGGKERDLLEAISAFGKARAEQGKAIVSLVGEELRSDSAVAGRVFKTIDEIQPSVILHGSSPIAMNFVVAEEEVEGVIARLHEVFFHQLDPDVFE